MELEQRQEVYKKAIQTWGKIPQVEMALEESIELALAIRKYLREPTPERYLQSSGRSSADIMMAKIIRLQGKLNSVNHGH